MPDYLTHTLAVLQGINNLGQSNAEIASRQQLTQMHEAETESIRTKIQQEKDGRASLAALAAARSANDQTSGNGPTEDFGGLGSTELGRPIVEGYKSEQRQAMVYRQMSDALLTGGGPMSEVDRYAKMADSADVKSRDWYTKAQSYAKQVRSEISSAAASVADDGSNLPDVLNQLNRLDPRTLNSPSFDRDENSGKVVWGANTQRALDTISKQNMTARETISLKREAERVAHDLANEEKNRADLERKQDREDRIAATQAAGQPERAALLRAQADTANARTDEIRARTEANKLKLAGLDAKAAKPATPSMKKSAMDDVRAQFKDTPFDSTIDAFAADVADHANKIMADEARAHNNIGADDARQRAIDDLSVYVKDKTSGGVDLPLVGRLGGKTEKTYVRGKPEAAAAPTITPIAAPQQVTTKAQRDALPSGTKYIGPDGKTWIKQ